MAFSDQEKREIESKIADVITSALDRGELTTDDLANISEFILRHLDVVQNEEQLHAILSQFSSQWPIFAQIQLNEQGGVVHKVENQEALMGDAARTVLTEKQQGQQLDQDHINRIGTQLTIRLGHALKRGEISEIDSPKTAQYILDRLSKVTTQEELIVFLQELSAKWSIFSDYLTLERSKTIKKEEEVTARHISNLIKQNKLDEALQIAKETHTNNTQMEAQ